MDVTWEEGDFGCQALSSCVTLGGSRGSTNQARTMPCERGESIQSLPCIRVWGCAHLQITLGSPAVSISFPPWHKRWDSAVKNADCQLLCFEEHCNGGVFSVCFINSRILSFFQKHMTQRSIWGGRSWRWGDWKLMGENCFSIVKYLLSARQETLQLCFDLYFCFCLETYSNGKYSFIRGDKLHSFRKDFNCRVCILFLLYSSALVHMRA